jgi:hypothetical protein
MPKRLLYAAFAVNVVAIVIAMFILIMGLANAAYTDAAFVGAISGICILSAVMTYMNAKSARKPPEDMQYLLYPQIKGTLIATALSKAFFGVAGIIAGLILITSNNMIPGVSTIMGVSVPLIISIVGDGMALRGTKNIFGM